MDTKESSDSKSPGEHVVTRSKRDLPPAHFSLKIECFSLLQETGVEKYESDVFEAGDYKWRLCLYPNGNPKGKRFVSLNLKLENTSDLPDPWEVNAEFKLFVFDQIKNKYLTVQDKNHPVKRFHEMKTEWGFDQFLTLETFRDSSKGYLVRDCCVFGAEVFVIKPTGNWELLSMVQKPAHGSTTWKIEDFSKLDKNSPLYKTFTAGGRSWKIKVYPGGNGKEKGNSLSVYLELVDGDKLPPKKAIWAEYKLRVLDQRRDKHVEKTEKTKVKVERTKGLSKENVLIWNAIRTTLDNDFRIWIQFDIGSPPPVFHLVSTSSCHWEISMKSRRAMC